MNILFAGFGNLAQQCAQHLQGWQKNAKIYTLSKSHKTQPFITHSAALDLANIGEVEKQLADYAQKEIVFDYIFITLAPSGLSGVSTHNRYVNSYLLPLKNLCSLWPKYLPMPAHVFYTSSTSVYHQSAGEWVDETSSTEPASENGKLLLQAEQQLQNSSFASTIIRLSGIYSERRQFLVRAVTDGMRGNDQYTNRIHELDASRVLDHLLRLVDGGSPIQQLYLASDCQPSTSQEVCRYIASRLGLPRTLADESQARRESSRAGNKRCANTCLLQTGFTFVYPSFREGYAFLAPD